MLKLKKLIYNEAIPEPLKLKHSYKNNPILVQRLMTSTPTTTISSNQLRDSETENYSTINSGKTKYRKSSINKLLTEEQYFTPTLKKLREEYKKKKENEIKRDYSITEGKIISDKLFKKKIKEIEKNSKIKKKKKIYPVLNITQKEYDRLKEIEIRNFSEKFRNNFHKVLDYEIKEFDNIIKSNHIHELKLMKNVYHGDIYFNDISLSKQLVDLNHQYQKEYDDIKLKRKKIEVPDFINKLMINKNDIDAKMKLDLIRIKNAKKIQTREKIRRTILALSAHLFRLKITLKEFLDSEEENENEKFNIYSNDFKKLINAIKDNNLSKVDYYLMKNKFLIKMIDDFNQTPLHIAAKRDNPELIKLLLEFGAKIDFEDCAGQTPLHISSKYNRIENVKILLLCLANPFKEDHQGNTADKLTTNKYIKFFINKCKTITEINLSRANMKKSIIYIRNGLNFFFKMNDRQLKTIVDDV